MSGFSKEECSSAYKSLRCNTKQITYELCMHTHLNTKIEVT